MRNRMPSCPRERDKQCAQQAVSVHAALMSAPEGQANAQTPTTTDPAGVIFDFARSPDSSRTQPRTKVVEPAKSIRIRLPTGSASAKNERMHPSSRTRLHTVGVFVAEPLAPDRYVVVCGALTA